MTAEDPTERLTSQPRAGEVCMASPSQEETTATEDELVERAKNGDMAAFESLYRQNVGRVYALCMRMCGDAGDAEELTQDAFVRAWERLPSFAGRSAFSTWLHRLAANVVLSRWRKRSRRPVVAFEEARSIETPEVAPRDGKKVDLERAIATLPDGARTVFVLHDVEGWKHHEVASMTGLAVGTSKAQLHRARRLLRKVLMS